MQMVFPIGRIPDEYPVYYVTDPAGLRELGSGSEPPCGSASDGSTRSANGCACPSARGRSGDPGHRAGTDDNRAAHADHYEGSGAWRSNHAASARAGNESANGSEYHAGNRTEQRERRNLRAGGLAG
jgi:hypothetical protein